MKNIIIIFTIFLSLVYHKLAFALTLTRPNVEALISQMSSVISNQNLNEIERFFLFYSTSDARFITNSIGVDPIDPNQTSEKITNLNRNEYITRIKDIVSTADEYGYKATVEQFHLNPGGNSAIVSIHIDEVSIGTIPNPERPRENLKVKTVASTNCNVNIQLAASTPIIDGMNCIEKIVIQ
jgi:hypothetical protein